MVENRLVQGDCLDVMRRMIAAGERVQSVVVDPPYHLTSVVKRFGKAGAAPALPGTDGVFVRQSRGFMGQTWDGGDIAFQPETWRLCWDLLPPGGYILAFGSSRTYGHLQAAMEKAGFITHPLIGWVFGSGFPKAHKIDGLDGWAYGGQALKPALEPIYMGQKPMEGTGAANWRKHGVGALNIEGCRVPASGRPRIEADYKPTSNSTWAGRVDDSLQGGFRAVGTTDLGRWPANLVHDGSPEVLAAFPETRGQASTTQGSDGEFSTSGVYGKLGRISSSPPRGDRGSAARFFYCAKASRKDRNEGCDEIEESALLWSAGEKSPGTFQSDGTNRAARNNHPTVKPTNLMRWLCRLITPPGGTVLDPFMGSGSTGKAAALEGFSFVGIEQDESYVEIARARIVAAGGRVQDPGSLSAAVSSLSASVQRLVSAIDGH